MNSKKKNKLKQNIEHKHNKLMNNKINYWTATKQTNDQQQN